MDSLSQFKIVLRPNNQISVTRQRLARKKEDRYESRRETVSSRSEINKAILTYAGREGLETVYCSETKRYSLKPVSVGFGAVALAAPLDLIRKVQQGFSEEQEKKAVSNRGYGETPKPRIFGHVAGQRLRECGATIDSLCGDDPSFCRVVTLTLPASGHDAYKAISDYSAEITNRLLQIIRRKEDHEDYFWFYVWEHQDRGALHFHLCLYHPNREQSAKAGSELVQKWRDILRDVGRKAGVNLLFSRGFGRVVASHEMQSLNQEMYRGCGNYFSKYAGKSTSKNDCSVEGRRLAVLASKYPVGRFWGRSRNLARLCEQRSFKYVFDGVEGADSQYLRSEVLAILEEAIVLDVKSFGFKKILDEGGENELPICEGFTEVFYVPPHEYRRLLTHFRFLYHDRPDTLIPERSKRKSAQIPCDLDSVF